MNDLTGQTIGQYYIFEKIGEGGMAEVYKASQSNLDRTVAIKFIRPEFATDATFQARFSREARAIARLNHQNIVHVYDSAQVGHRYYLVMEYIEGRELSDYLSNWYASGRGMPVNQAFSIIQQIGNALDYAHQQGIIHRDIKPSNILITRNGRVVLTDFGIAKIVDISGELTRTGTAMGTPSYMAPEQIQGDKNKIGPASDLYSLGIILYQMATGQLPFTGHTPMSVMLKHLSEPIPPPRVLNPQLPRPVEQVILKALAKEPAHRYQSAYQMISDLQQALSYFPEWSEMGLPSSGPRQEKRGKPPGEGPQWGASGRQPPHFSGQPGSSFGGQQAPSGSQQWSGGQQMPSSGQQTPSGGQQWSGGQQTPSGGQQWSVGQQVPSGGQQWSGGQQTPSGGQQWSGGQQVPSGGQQWSSFGGQHPPTPQEQWSPSSGNTVQVIGFGRRAVAYLIDTILLAIVGAIVGGFTGLTIGIGSALTGASSDLTMNLTQLTSQCLGYLINGVYFVGFWATTGQTIGYLAMGIKVVETNGQRLSWGKAIARYVGYFISGLVLALGFASAAFDEKRQGWHDKIANTYVVRKDASFSSADNVTFVPSDPDNSGKVLVVLLYGLFIFSCFGLIFLIAAAGN